jgi:hypothetical protein
VRTHAIPISAVDSCLAYAPRLPPGHFFSHTSAAAIYGMPMPARFERAGPVHVSAAPPAHPPQARGVIGHLLEGVDVRTYRGLRVIDPAQAWAQLGTLLPHNDLVVAGDHLVRRKRPLATLEQLRDAARATRRPGIRAIRRALNDVRAETDSPMETRLRLILVGGGLPEPAIGHPVVDAQGQFVATPDLAYVRERIAIEYEGEHHWSNRWVIAEDIARRDGMEEAGWQVIRVIKEHLGLAAPLLVARKARALAVRAPR